MHSIRKYDNVLLFTNGAIGDFLMAALCADSIGKKLVGSTISILTPRNAALLRDLFSAYPHVRVYEINRRHFLRLILLVIRKAWQKNIVVNQVVFKKIPIHLQLFARLLTMRPGSTYARFTQKDAGNGALIFDSRLSAYENLARLVNTQNLNVSLSVPPYRFVRDPRVFERYGLGRSSYVVVHPCAWSASRSLPVTRWADLLRYVTVNFPDLKIVITGSAYDRSFIQKIFDTTSSTVKFVNLAGKLSMMELANIVDGARGYVGVDTGITHLAGVLRKPSVIIGNRSNPYWLPHYNENAVILTESKNCTCDGKKGGNCFYRTGEEKYYKCMLDIPEESIYEKIKHMLMKERRA